VLHYWYSNGHVYVVDFVSLSRLSVLGLGTSTILFCLLFFYHNQFVGRGHVRRASINDLRRLGHVK
jgi:hypothetical protein